MFAGSMLGEETVRPVPRSDGTTDLYIAADSFHDVFCQDLPAWQAALMAATQRPATQEALVEPSGDHPLWKGVPAWFLIGEEDRVIPVELQRYMAHRAGSQRTTVIEVASHAMPVSRADATVHQILQAAGAPRDRLRWSRCAVLRTRSRSSHSGRCARLQTPTYRRTHWRSIPSLPPIREHDRSAPVKATPKTRVKGDDMTTAHHEEIEHLALEAEVAGGGGLRAVEVAAVVLAGLLVCPPLAILVVVVAVPLLVTAVVLGLLAAVLATPYVLVRHLRGHPGGHLPLLAHRLRHAGRALFDLAPHRIHADTRRLNPGR